MNEYKYSLHKGSRKWICPQCEKKRFVLYIDNQTGEPLHSTVGKCDRADNCNYHLTPKQYFAENNLSTKEGVKSYTPYQRKSAPLPKSKPSYIEPKLLKQSMRDYDHNLFIQFLVQHYGTQQTNFVVDRYYIGLSDYWKGATIFWQIDIDYRIRTGKIMLYNPDTGKRIKEPNNRIGWVHTTIKQSNFTLSQCLFGEHLLKDTAKLVAVVEAEKTAIIASIAMPQYVWVATGGADGLTAEKCAVLKGRTVILFPDLGKFNEWSEKAKVVLDGAQYTVSYTLESKATEEERKSGLDLADYLLKESMRK